MKKMSSIYMTGAGRCTYLDRINGELDYKGAARRILDKLANSVDEKEVTDDGRH